MSSLGIAWWTGPAGSLSSEAHGFALSVRRPKEGGWIQFRVLSDHDGTRAQYCLFASGNARSASEAMASAEDAAAFIALWPPPLWELGIGAAGQCMLWPRFKSSASRSPLTARIGPPHQDWGHANGAH
jgi:hypothetical protein